MDIGTIIGILTGLTYGFVVFIFLMIVIYVLLLNKKSKKQDNVNQDNNVIKNEDPIKYYDNNDDVL